MFQLLSSRKIKKEAQTQEPGPPKNHLVELFKLILPPFIVSIIVFLFKITVKILAFVISLFIKKYDQVGEASREFRKRNYQAPIETLKIKQQDLGFTNQVLVQQNKKTVNFFLPVYITNKIKSIQDVSVQSLTGNISCAIIINVFFGDIPEEIIKKLENSIVLQLNRGQSMILADDGITITVKRDKKARFLIFTLRKIFLGFLIEDTLWSPFQMLRLIISITLNTVSIQPHSLQVLQQQRTGYNPDKQYKISFNCMRNSDLIPMSFALDCVYGVYDLAQRKMESYHTNLGTYKQVEKKHEEYLQKKKSNKDKKQKKQKKQEKKDLQKRKGREQKQKQQNVEKQKTIKKQEKCNDPLAGLLLVKQIAQTTVRRISMRVFHNEAKVPPKKVKYFQYTHFIIPLYKYPGNSLITIFLPILMLALLSLAIFFQDPQLSGRIGAIATMILGYIALIPSIKQQLPPSSKLTVVQFLVYIQALSCMLCLYESFIIRNLDSYQFIWFENINFLLCLIIHSCIFLFVAGLYFIHKVKWQPEYNCDQKVPEIKPAQNPQSWDNPYCDEVFIKYNNQIMQKQTGATRDQMLIKPYKNLSAATEKANKKDKNFIFDYRDNAPVSLSEFQNAPQGQDMLSSQVRSITLNKPGSGFLDFLMQPTSPKSMSEFVSPDQKLYYQEKQ